MCIWITDSLCYTSKTNTILKRNDTPIKFLKNKIKKEKGLCPIHYRPVGYPELHTDL